MALASVPVFPPRKVLVVDDHPDTLALCTIMLEGEGHNVFAAENGRIAAELAESNLPDVIFSDLVLPELDGFKLSRRLRDQPRFDRSVMVALSGLTDAESIEKAAGAGFDYYAVKPLEPEIFLNSVYAPRQDALILLSEMLLEQSERLLRRSETLSGRSREIQQRSQSLIDKWRKRLPLFRSPDDSI